jgi:hypothetical protein
MHYAWLTENRAERFEHGGIRPIFDEQPTEIPATC